MLRTFALWRVLGWVRIGRAYSFPRTLYVGQFYFHRPNHRGSQPCCMTAVFGLLNVCFLFIKVSMIFPPPPPLSLSLLGLGEWGAGGWGGGGGGGQHLASRTLMKNEISTPDTISVFALSYYAHKNIDCANFLTCCSFCEFHFPVMVTDGFP